MNIMEVSQPVITAEQAKQNVLNKVRSFAKSRSDRDDGDEYGFEIYCDYNDKLGNSSLAEISRSDFPREKFYDIMEEDRCNNEDYYYPEFIEEIKRELNDEEFDEYEDAIREWIDEHVYWYMPEEHFNTEVDVVIALDVGDANTDFTKCNILNYYRDTADMEIPHDSPIRWLAEQQDKLDEVEHLIRLYKDDAVKEIDPDYFSDFAKTVQQELANACSHMNTLVFLASMELFDFFKLRELIKADEELNKFSDYANRQGKGEFVVTKNAMCGLFDIWQGGGSVLGIELEKDVVIPTKSIFDVWIDCEGCKCNGRGYDVDSVYGFTREAWRGQVILA